MTKVIYKFALPEDFGARCGIPMQHGASILTAQLQGDDICIWAIVDPTAKTVLRYFRIFGTGQSLRDIASLTYVATVQQGMFVWHVFAEATLNA